MHIWRNKIKFVVVIPIASCGQNETSVRIKQSPQATSGKLENIYVKAK